MQAKSTVPVGSPITLNDTWGGFKHDDHSWRSAIDVAERLAAIASRNANLLLNIGPTPAGDLPEPAANVLGELAVWHARYPDAIRGTEPSPSPLTFPWGYCTQSDSRLHFFIRDGSEVLSIVGIRSPVIEATVAFEQQDDPSGACHRKKKTCSAFGG